MRLFVLMGIGIPLSSAWGQGQMPAFDVKKVQAREHFNVGMRYLYDNSYEAAIAKFFEALKHDSDNHRTRYFLGMAFYKAGYTPEAIAQWENILKLGMQDALLEQKIQHLFYVKGKQQPSKDLYKNYVYLQRFPLTRKTLLQERLLELPTGIGVDAYNRVYVVDFARHAFLRFDPNGENVHPIIHRTASGMPRIGLNLKHPYDLIMDRDGFFYLSDFGHNRVIRIDEAGKLLGEFKTPEQAPAQQILRGPEGMALDALGNLYVSDVGNSSIHYYNREGVWLSSFGKRGSNEGEIAFPSSLAYDVTEGRLYVSDKGNNRITVFDKAGRFIEHFGGDFLKQPQKILLDQPVKNVMTLLDEVDIYHYDMQAKTHRSLFDKAGVTSLPRGERVSMAYDLMGLLYVGNAHRNTIDIYSPKQLLYVNLFVQVERIYLRDFPRVRLTLSVRTKEGLRIAGLSRINFDIVEAGQRPSFTVNPLSGLEERGLRPVIMYEASLESKKQKEIGRILLRELFETFSSEELSMAYRYGGGQPSGQDTFHVASDYNNSILDKTQRLIEGTYHKDFFVGTVLKRAIGENLKFHARRGILLICFQAYAHETFLPEKYDALVDYAAHNGVPIYVLYAGAQIQKAQEDKFSYLERLAEKTGGQFYVYRSRQTIQQLVGTMRRFENGFYELGYTSMRDDLRRGQFRPVTVTATYKQLVGKDDKAGYPIP